MAGYGFEEKTMKRAIALGASIMLGLGAGYGQAPPVLNMQLSNGVVRLQMTGSVGAAYRIERTAGFGRAGGWQVLTNRAVLAGSPCVVIDKDGGQPGCFYRAQVVVSPSASNMVWIPAGSFVMGSPASEALRFADETQHTVTLSKGFYMGKYPVTQREYLKVMGKNPSFFTGDLDRPVEEVSWKDATNYCGRLTQQERAAGRLAAGWGFRLPTESEWEYACRAGTTTAFHYGNALRQGMANFFTYNEYDAAIGNISTNSSGVGYQGRPVAGGSYPPNAWGLYDMHGNVLEWCRDWYGAYPKGSVVDPQGPASGMNRAMRGGYWFSDAAYCRAAYRHCNGYPGLRSGCTGFRVVLSSGQP